MSKGNTRLAILILDNFTAFHVIIATDKFQNYAKNGANAFYAVTYRI